LENIKKTILENKQAFAGIAIISIIIGLSAGFVVFSPQEPSSPTGDPAGTTLELTDSEIQAKTGAYLGDNSLALFGAELQFTVKDINKFSDSMYSVTVEAINEGENLGDAIFYVTPDAKYIVLSGILNLDEKLMVPQEGQPAEGPEIEVEFEKSDRPNVELFVMSFCPYGLKAANNLKGVLGILEDKIDYNFYYLLSLPSEGYEGSTDQYCYLGYCSMHGKGEVTENLRQMCIRDNYPDKWYSYVSYISEKYDAQEWSASNIDDVWEEAAEAAGLDVAEIQSCFDNEGQALLDAEYDFQQSYATRGSPSVFLNGVYWSGAVTSSTANPDGYKEGICSVFNTPPEECYQALSDESISGGSC